MKLRLVLLAVFAALVAVLAVAGCGGGGDDSGSGTDPAEAAPPNASVFVAGKLKPGEDIGGNIDALAKRVAGIDSVGDLIAEELEESAASEGEDIDFESEVEPWVGEDVGLYLREYDGENFEAIGIALQLEDEGEAEDFIESHLDEDEKPLEEDTYEDVDIKTTADGTTYAFTDGLLLVGDEQENIEEAIDALGGDNLAGEDAFNEAIDEEPDGSFASIYVDIGGLIDEVGAEIPAETEAGFDLLGIEPKEATALISLIPNSDNIEMDISSNIGTGDTATGGDASGLLESLPADSIAAVATAEFGKGIQETIDRIDAEGIPGELPPNQLKKQLSQSGVDVESIVGSLGDLGLFVSGPDVEGLGGAVVIEATDASEAENTVQNLGLLLRSSGTPGVAPIKEAGISGFSISDSEIGPEPLVVAAASGRIVIGYSAEAAIEALKGTGETLGDDPAFGEAQAALGSTPISGFLSGRTVLPLAEEFIDAYPAPEVEALEPYLEKMSYLAFGGSSSGDTSSAKLILGFNE